jgi:hypothetical protein
MADYPRPTKLGTPPATVGVKPTAQYRDPLTYLGRFVLSDQTTAVQNLGIRTVRARALRQAPNKRLYIGLGEAVGAYGLDKFLTLLTKPLGGPAAIVNATVSGRDPTPVEQVAKPESFWYGESPQSGWTGQDGGPPEGNDVQATLGGFDVDDRGLLYVATRAFGWGISKDTGARHMELVYQNKTDNIIGEEVISLKVGNSYYVVLSDGRFALIYDATDPANPKLMATPPGRKDGIIVSAKHDASAQLSWIAADGILYTADYGVFVGVKTGSIGRLPRPDAKKWKDVAFTENGALWAVESGPAGPADTSSKLIEVTKQKSHDVYGGPFSPERIAVGSGLIAVAGRQSTKAPPPMDIRLFDASGAVPTEIPTGNFFRDFYFAPPADNVKIGQYIGLEDMRIITHNGKRYLLLSAMGIGDVYEVGGAVPAGPTTPTNPTGPQPPAQKTCPTCGGSGKVPA